MYTPYKKPPQIFCDVWRGLTIRRQRWHQATNPQSPSTIESRDTMPRRMQEVNSMYTDSRFFRAEYCIVGIPHNTAI